MNNVFWFAVTTVNKFHNLFKKAKPNAHQSNYSHRSDIKLQSKDF